MHLLFIHSFSRPVFSEQLVHTKHCIRDAAVNAVPALKGLVGKAESREYTDEQEEYHSSGIVQKMSSLRR